MKYLISAIFLATVGIVNGQQADAKSLSQMIADTGLSPEDFNLMSAATDALLAKGTPKTGQQQSWSNADTKSKGVVRVQGLRNNCVYLQHQTYPKGRAKPFELRNRLCKDKSGNWVAVP